MYFSGYGGKLWKAALVYNALEHQLAMLRWRGRKERPDIGDSLLVSPGEFVEFLFPNAVSA
jgi:hypothetical protein